MAYRWNGRKHFVPIFVLYRSNANVGLYWKSFFHYTGSVFPCFFPIEEDNHTAHCSSYNGCRVDLCPPACSPFARHVKIDWDSIRNFFLHLRFFSCHIRHQLFFVLLFFHNSDTNSYDHHYVYRHWIQNQTRDIPRKPATLASGKTRTSNSQGSGYARRYSSCLDRFSFSINTFTDRLFYRLNQYLQQF